MAAIIGISVVFIPHGTAHEANNKATVCQQENTVVPSPTITTATYKANEKVFSCKDEESLVYIDFPWWKTWWNLEKDQVTQLQFFDSCHYRKNFPEWKLNDYEGIVDAKIMAYTKDYRREVNIKNWTFRKVIYLYRGVQIINRTELVPYPKEDVTSYLLRIENPMENEDIYLYYFHDDNGIVAVGWGDKTTGVLKKYDAGSDSGPSYGGSDSSAGGPANGDIPGGPADGPIPSGPADGDIPSGPADSDVPSDTGGPADGDIPSGPADGPI